MSVRDTLGRPLRDLRISVTDRCNFRCVYCMPKEVFGRDYRVPRPAGAAHLRGDRAARARLRRARRREDPASPAASRSSAATSSAWSRMLAAIDGLDLTLTTNGVAARRRRRRRSRDAGLQRVTVSLDSLDDDVFRAMNDVDFPVARVLEGIDAAAAAGPAGEGQHGRQARRERRQRSSPMARHFRGTRPHPALHRVHGRRPHERLAARRRRAGRRDRRRDRRRAAARAGRAQLPRRGRAALALPRRRRRDRRDRLGHAAVLRRLHARAALGRGPALHVPLRACAATTCARSSAAARRTRSSRDAIGADLAPAHRPLLGDPHRRTRSTLPKVEMSLHRRLSRSKDIERPTGRGTLVSACPCRERRIRHDAAVVAIGHVDTCRGAGATSACQLAIWFGFLGALPGRAGHRRPQPDAGVRERPAASSASRSASATFRADAAAARRSSHFLDAARLVDVLELGVHGRRADAPLGLPAAQRGFIRFRNWILLANVIGLVGYVVVPTAPPRMFPTFGFADTLAQFGSLNHGSGLIQLAANPYAAMPSLHAADALIVGISMALVCRHWWAKTLWLALAGLGLVRGHGDRQPLLARHPRPASSSRSLAGASSSTARRAILRRRSPARSPAASADASRAWTSSPALHRRRARRIASRSMTGLARTRG